MEKVIIQTVNSYLKKRYNNVIDFNFEIIENRIFLFIENETGSVLGKKDLNIDPLDFDSLFLSLYDSFKIKYLNSQTERINVLKIEDLLDNYGYYITLNVSDIHGNKIRLVLKHNNYLKDTLEFIWQDWIDLVNELKPSKGK